jgi:hypothetical protein
MAAADTHATTEELLESVSSLPSIPRLYNKGELPLEESLETAIRIGGWCEMPTNLGVS